MGATAEWTMNARHAPPPPLQDAVRRAALLAAVQAERHRPLLLLQAPAGFGKTIFLAQWHDEIRASGALAAWVSLEAGDGNGDALVAALALALVNAGILDAAGTLLPAPDRAAMAALDALAGRIQSVRRETWLVIDNWDLAQSDEATGLLAALLRRLPPNWHVALAGRAPPRLPLAALRAGGRLIEIGADALRLDDAEALALLASAGCAPAAGEAIINATRGWPIAVKLAGLGGGAGTAAPLAAIEGMGDYLEEEVFAALDAPMRNFLLEISICRQFSREMAAFIRDTPDTAAMIDALKPLRGIVDTAGDGLCLHPLMAVFLADRRHRIDAERLRQLHRRAADWFESRGQFDEAVGHALAGGDQARSVRLVESANCLDLCIRTGAPAVHSLLEKLPENIVRERPRLRAAWAAMNLKRGSIAEARSLTSELRRGLAAKDDDALERDIFILENLSLCFIDTSPSADEIAAYRREMDNAGAEEWWIDALRCNVYGRLEMRAGHLKEAHAALERAFAILEGGGSAHGCFFMSIHIAFCNLFLGRLTVAEDWLRRARTVLARDLDGDAIYACIASSAESLLHYEANDLAEAGRLAQIALAGLEQAEGCFEQYLVSVYVGASCAFALSGLDAAMEVLGRGRKLALFHGLDVMDRVLVGMTAGFHARAGQWDADAVARFGNGERPDCAWLEADITAPVHGLIARHEGRPDDARRHAMAAIERSRAGGRIAAEVRAHLSMARIAADEGEGAAARDALSRAVVLASPESLFQPFFEMDDHLLPLLRDLSKSAPARMPPFAASFLSNLVLRMVATRKARDHGETLTSREREILAHLADGVSRKEITSNKEIARALDLTENAVKFHLKNVFRKLDVKNRDMAAAVARLLETNAPDPAGHNHGAPWPTHH
ncbi:LuxR C-terminal-related transcriptional regulator [Sphingomonas colocasiae]|uniref:LuxR C-terminal-related transcriptional regulator n=1 Tax=Sphingomonas colocasiae TaxID=1848973 RepID=A0ABS7PUW8_9SPHN|nr:LuxR C-terminal-related transcriptional regulator [Sphingomonas colocasiae]MBY8824941.1 LuxR C-terminal-related transcriptional regulator [Sphingomonas colocasiae]